MNQKVIIICLILSFTLSCSKQSQKPVNPNASKEAKELLSFIYSIKGDKLITGQYNYSSELSISMDSVKNFTGKFPLLWGSDIAYVDHAYHFKQKVVDEAIKWHKKGAIITLMSPSKIDFTL